MRVDGPYALLPPRSSSVLVQVKVQSLGLERSTNQPVLILQELDGDRVLPIYIGPAEASAIAMRLASMEFARPLTHDLLVSILQGLGGSVQKVIITKVEMMTYYAELIVRRNGQVFSVDARPSDSIAVALRVDASIFVQEELLEQASIEIADEESANAVDPSDAMPRDLSEPMGPAELEAYLRRLNPEDFGRFNP